MYAYVAARLEETVGVLHCSAYLQCSGAEVHVRCKIVDDGIPSELLASGHAERDAALVDAALSSFQLLEPLLVAYLKVGIHYVVLVYSAKFYRAHLALYVCSDRVFCQSYSPVLRCLDIAVAKFGLRCLECGTCIVNSRFAALYAALCLQQLYLAHGIAVDSLLHALIVAVGIFKFRLRSVQCGFGLCNSIFVQYGFNHEQLFAFLYTASLDKTSFEYRTVHTSDNGYRGIGIEIPRIVAFERYVLYLRLGNLNRQ